MVTSSIPKTNGNVEGHKMGRTKEQGSKNLIRVIHTPRFQTVHFMNGSTNLKMLIATNSYDKIVAGFEKRGYKIIHD